MTLGHVALAMMVAVAAVATRLRVAFRKNVQCPAADELGAGKSDVFGLVAAAGLLACSRAERDVAVFVSHQSSIRDRTAGHVARQVFQHLIGSRVRRRRRLDVRDGPKITPATDTSSWRALGVSRAGVSVGQRGRSVGRGLSRTADAEGSPVRSASCRSYLRPVS